LFIDNRPRSITSVNITGFGVGAASIDTRRPGGGSEYLCLPLTPEWKKYDRINDGLAHSFVSTIFQKNKRSVTAC